jgi:hypothetical protein
MIKQSLLLIGLGEPPLVENANRLLPAHFGDPIAEYNYNAAKYALRLDPIESARHEECHPRREPKIFLTKNIQINRGDQSWGTAAPVQ